MGWKKKSEKTFFFLDVYCKIGRLIESYMILKHD